VLFFGGRGCSATTRISRSVSKTSNDGIEEHIKKRKEISRLLEHHYQQHSRLLFFLFQHPISYLLHLLLLRILLIRLICAFNNYDEKPRSLFCFKEKGSYIVGIPKIIQKRDLIFSEFIQKIFFVSRNRKNYFLTPT
jgi:hypothetical protein